MKKINCLTIIMLLFVLQTLQAQQPRFIHTARYEGVVFSRYCWQNLEIAKNPYIPTDAEIEKMERKIGYSIRILLLDAMKRQDNQGRCQIVEELQTFKRQYYGYWKGKEKIILTYFYKYPPKTWKTELEPISQNGQCDEFSLQYSINTDSLFDFFVDLSKE